MSDGRVVHNQTRLIEALEDGKYIQGKSNDDGVNFLRTSDDRVLHNRSHVRPLRP